VAQKEGLNGRHVWGAQDSLGFAQGNGMRQAGHECASACPLVYELEPPRFAAQAMLPHESRHGDE
jgi:hypothetical protein